MSWLDDLLSSDTLQSVGDWIGSPQGAKATDALFNLGLSYGADALGWNDPQIQKTGYLGEIPKYDAVRERVPNTYDPTRRPGSSGQRYFTDTRFVPRGTQPAPLGAEGLAALNLNNPARQTRPVAPVVTPTPVPTNLISPPTTLAHGGIAGLKKGRYIKPRTPEQERQDRMKYLENPDRPRTPRRTGMGGKWAPRRPRQDRGTDYEDTKRSVLRDMLNSRAARDLRELGPNVTGPEIIPEFHPRHGYPVLGRNRNQQLLDEKYGPTVSVEDMLKGRHHKAGQEIQTSGGTILRKHGGIIGLRRGRYLDGPTSGMADEVHANIEGTQEARLSDGEFVVPADVVSHLGNGNSDAGADELYDMMDRVRKARTGTTKQAKEIDPKEFLPV